ncbi:MAG: hypothetical protein EXX96DRAFT_575298 [Benjaminiella poitrasii]|nr:MAG: hypothetical protein EXX96DRAFT_575298 [Benjaminiella poitrasii]
MGIYECKIIELANKNIIFRKCGKCSKSIVSMKPNDVIDNVQFFYCGYCKKCVHEFKVNYKLQIICMNIIENTIEMFEAYDQVVDSIMGCTADEFIKYLEKDPSLMEKTELQFKGMHCTLESKEMKKKDKNTSSSKSNKVIGFKVQDEFKIINVLKNLYNEYDSSLEAIKNNTLFIT